MKTMLNSVVPLEYECSNSSSISDKRRSSASSGLVSSSSESRTAAKRRSNRKSARKVGNRPKTVEELLKRIGLEVCRNI